MNATEDMSDARLLELSLIDDYCQRFEAKEFVVFDTDRRAYVESIDTYDGCTEWTTNPRHARIFQGYEWAKIWAKKGRTFMLPHNLPQEPR